MHKQADQILPQLLMEQSDTGDLIICISFIDGVNTIFQAFFIWQHIKAMLLEEVKLKEIKPNGTR